MRPTSFRQTNFIYSKPDSMTDEECDQLAVYRDPQGQFSVSCWKLSPQELEEIARTGKVWVHHVGGFMQPLSLFTQNPFE